MPSFFRRLFSFNSADIGIGIFIFILLLGGVLLITLSGNKKGKRASEVSPTEKSFSKADSTQVLKDSVRTVRDERRLIDSLSRETSEEYVGPPAYSEYKPKRRLPQGATIDLNLSDSTTLMLVPGIGSSFARRIIGLRTRLGGFYTVLQLQEVYGMTPDRYRDIKPYFVIGNPPQKIDLATMPYDSIPRHPYLSFDQRNAIERILFRDGKLRGWQQIGMLECFTKQDSVRLSHYFTFE